MEAYKAPKVTCGSKNDELNARDSGALGGFTRTISLNGNPFDVEIEPLCCSAFVENSADFPVRYLVSNVKTVNESQRHFMNLKLVNERRTLILTVGGPIRKAEVPKSVRVKCTKNGVHRGRTVSGEIEWLDGTTQPIVGGIVEPTSPADRERIRQARQALEDGLCGDGDGKTDWVCDYFDEEEPAAAGGAGDDRGLARDFNVAEKRDGYRTLVIAGSVVDLSKNHKARDFLKFLCEKLKGCTDKIFLRDEMRDMYNAQFDGQEAKKWRSLRLREDLFKRLSVSEFALLFDTLDAKSGRYRLKL